VLAPGVPDDPPDDVYRDHVGIHPQKQRDFCYVGTAVLRGRLTAEQMRAAAELSERYGSGVIRTTSMQNLVIPNVPRDHASSLARALELVGLPLDASPFRRGTVACTGSEFCKLALTETKGFARDLVETLERQLPGFDQHIKIHVTGCPNSCGQHWIADLGIEGKRGKVGGQLVAADVIAERRIESLLAAAADVTVISPQVTLALAKLATEGRIDVERRAYREGDLARFDLVLVATDRGEVNAAVAREAHERGVWINAADDPANCTFILPALVRRGDLTVAVSTGGTSPALARKVREELAHHLTAEYATLAAIAGDVRRELRALGRPVTADAWRRALRPDVRQRTGARGRAARTARRPAQGRRSVRLRQGR